MPSALPIKTIYYPDSDGKPMAESDLHRDEMVREINVLQRHFADQKVYVSGNLLVYYVEGNPKKCFSPDVLVAKGVVQRRRRTYQFWRERVVPQVVIEVSSKKTKKQDINDKAKLYAELGIKEYFLFDPTEDYLNPPLQGYRLEGDSYVRMAAEEDGSLISQELELRLDPQGEELGFFRLDNGARLLSSEEGRVIEEKRRLLAEEARAVAEGQRKQAEDMLSQAEAEIARLREELHRAKAEK